MRKERLLYICIFLTIGIVASIPFCNLQLFTIPKVLAETIWTDTFSIYRNITVLESAIRTITNNYDFPIDIKVYLISTTNIAKLDSYKTLGNSTLFVWISSGSIIRQENIYPSLNPGEKLTFDISAKPAITLALGDTITLQKKIEIYKAVVAPPIIIITPPAVPFLDLTVIQYPSIVYMPFERSFRATLLITNKATVSYDVPVKWWLEDVQGNIYDGGQLTVFVSGMEKKQVEIIVPTPSVDGIYTLHTKTTAPVIVLAKAIIEVTTIPIWLIILVIIILVCLTTYVLYKKRIK